MGTHGHPSWVLQPSCIREALAEEGRAEADYIPVVKLFTPDAACTWILTELDPEDPDIAVGLCDLGMGYPGLGSVRISEIESVSARPILQWHFAGEKHKRDDVLLNLRSKADRSG